MEKKKEKRTAAAKLVYDASPKYDGATLTQLASAVNWLLESGFGTHGTRDTYAQRRIGYIRQGCVLLFDDMKIDNGVEIRVSAYGELREKPKRWVWRAGVEFEDKDRETFRSQLQTSCGFEASEEQDVSTAVFKAVRMAMAVDDLYNAERHKTDKTRKIIAGYLRKRMDSDFSTATGEDCDVSRLPLLVAQCEEG